MCGVLLGVGCSIEVTDNLFWTVDIPEKQNYKMSNSKLENTKKVCRCNNKKEIYKIVQITDIHLDPRYFVGSNSECGDPLCCRQENGIVNDSRAAGNWGAYPCDLPLVTVRNALEEIVENEQDINLWYWTGDVVAHDIWECARESNIISSLAVTKLLEMHTNTNAIILPAIGNHEAVPVNWFVIRFLSFFGLIKNFFVLSQIF